MPGGGSGTYGTWRRGPARAFGDQGITQFCWGKNGSGGGEDRQIDKGQGSKEPGRHVTQGPPGSRDRLLSRGGRGSLERFPVTTPARRMGVPTVKGADPLCSHVTSESLRVGGVGREWLSCEQYLHSQNNVTNEYLTRAHEVLITILGGWMRGDQGGLHRDLS